MSLGRDTDSAAEMEARKYTLNDDRVLLIREAMVDDAGVILDYIEAVTDETDFLNFGPGEFELDRRAEKTVLREYLETENRLYILGLSDDWVVSTLITIACAWIYCRDQAIPCGLSAERVDL